MLEISQVHKSTYRTVVCGRFCKDAYIGQRGKKTKTAAQRGKKQNVGQRGKKHRMLDEERNRDGTGSSSHIVFFLRKNVEKS